MRAWNRKQDREDLRFAGIQAILAELNRDPKKRVRPFQPTDFVRLREKYEDASKSESEFPEWKNHLAMVEMLNAALGGRDLRKERAAGLVDACGRPIQTETEHEDESESDGHR